MTNLVQPTEKDLTSLRNYVFNQIDKSLIDDIKFVWNSISERQPDTWEALAIRFKIDVNQNDLIRAVTMLHANEYHGMQDGYHIFWFD